MKHIIFILFFIYTSCIACSSDNDKSSLPAIRPDAEGTWIDPRDNSTYHWVRYGNLEWMTENMRAKPTAGDAVLYEDASTEDVFHEYGYLYDFTGANHLNIEGWRVPSEKDWQSLERYLGMSEKETQEVGWRGHFIGELLMQDANGSGLSMKCGGYAHSLGGFGTRAFGVDGIYWSSTPDESTEGYAWCRMLTFNKSEVRRESMTTKRYMSVRLVRDVQ